MAHMLTGVLLILYCTLSGSLPTVNFSCPAFRDRELNTMSCTVNRTALIEGCFPEPVSVMFDRTLGSTTTTLCKVSPIFDSSACSPASKSAAGRCWCNGYKGEMFEYMFAYTPSQSRDAGGQLECKICVIPKKPLDVTTSEICKNLTVDNLDSRDSNAGVRVLQTIEIIVACCIVTYIALVTI